MTDFEKIYKTYFTDVFLFIKSLANDEDIAEEITSLTFFKAMRSIDQFRGDCDLRVWLCQIAKNTYYSYLKKHDRITEIEDIDAVDRTEMRKIEERLIDREDARRVHGHLHDLAEPYKEVFMLRVFGELSYKEIGRLFSRTENWACVTFYRAKNKILAKMEEQHGK